MYVTGVNMATGEDVRKQVSATKDVTDYPDVNLNQIYKSEHILNDPETPMETKVKALITTWNELAALKPFPTKENLHTLAKFLLSNTLNIVLSVSWMKYKNLYHKPLGSIIEVCLLKYGSFNEFKIVCTQLLALVKSPWAKKIIKKMLNNEITAPSKEEYNFFVFEESAYIISMRLKMLCEEECGDIALNLTRCYLNCCEWAEQQNLSMCMSDNQRKFVFDIYLALLYQHDGVLEMSNLLKTIEISEGIDMVRRFATKTSSKLWENNIRIAQLSGTIFLTRCVMRPLEETSFHLNELLSVWLFVYESENDKEELIESSRRIIKNALTAPHMYLFLEKLFIKFGRKLRSYCVEVCIQALNTDLNVLEKVKTEENSELSELVSSRVAEGLLRLANLLEENLNVSRECVLSAFSVKPSRGCLVKIEEMARASGYQVLDTGQWSCKFHAPPDSDDEILIQCDACGDYAAELKISRALKQPNTALAEAIRANNMGLSSELTDDLFVIIFCMRYQMLSWLQNWKDLQRLCIMYLDDPVRTKNLITELKFVEIDYTPFMIKREMGFDEEECVDAELSMHFRDKKVKKRKREFLDDDDESQTYLTFGTKSDPDVLKALRSFRRALKDKNIIVEQSLSESPAAESTSAAASDEQYNPTNLPIIQTPNTCDDPIKESLMQGNFSEVPVIRNALKTEPCDSSEAESNTVVDKLHLSSNGEDQSPPLIEFQDQIKIEPPNIEVEETISEVREVKEEAKFCEDAEMVQSACEEDVSNCDDCLSCNCQSPDGTLPEDEDTNDLNSSSQNYVDPPSSNYFKLKNCVIVLDRIDDTVFVKQRISYKKRMRHRKHHSKMDNKMKARRKSSENVVQSQTLKAIDPTMDPFSSRSAIPLQCQNPKVLSPINNVTLEALKKQLLVSTDKMNPRVLLTRLEDVCVKSLLRAVPGIDDMTLFRPTDTDRIVNVVQVAGGRATSTVQSPNTQTSTQVSPHIQRIGQPRSDKSDAANAETATTTANVKSTANSYTISKPATTQSSTLINILSQQLIRPTNSNSNKPRSGPLINIISQQTIKSADTTNTGTTKSIATAVTTEPQNNNTRIVATSSEQQQILNQLVNPSRSGGTLKTVVGTSNSEPGRIVQFICKSTDGKLIPVTSFPSNRLVKVAPTAQVPSESNIEEFAKIVQSKKTESEVSETLPKFQQAFGKSVYQNSVDSTNPTNNTDNDKSKVQITQIKNNTSTTINVQPIQGGVIYTRQMPVGQTINLIPQTRGQVFRIATTNPEQISLVKDTVIHSKMSALLAAALQGKPKGVEVSTEDSSKSTTSTASATRVHITRPTLVQNARIVKPVLQIPANVIRNAPQPNLSSTTLEQLREFDMVYKQVKERSSSTPADAAAMNEAESSPQRISVTYLNQGQKVNCAPVVVVSTYNSIQPAASPLSVTSQGSSSPSVTPAPTPTPVLPKVATKNSKGKSVKNPPMHTSKTSPIPKPQQKPQEDEHTTQRIFDILAEYAEQLRNSPDLNNKPAPRRRSNPPTNPSQSSKRKKSSSSKKSGQGTSMSTEADVDDPRTAESEDSSCGVVQLSMQEEEQTPTTASTSESNDSTNHVTSRQQLILTDSTHTQTRNLIIADSSVGEALKIPNTAVLVPGNYIMPVSMVKGGQQIAVVSGGSKILATVPARSGPNMLLFQSFLNQNRKANLPSVKYSSIQPISGISSQTLTGVSAQPPVILPPPSHGISTVTLGQPIAIKKLDEIERVNTELLLTISQSREQSGATSEDVSQPDSSTSVNKLDPDIDENTAMSDNTSEKQFSTLKKVTMPVATPVISQTVKEEIEEEDDEEIGEEHLENSPPEAIIDVEIKSEQTKAAASKSEERVQSVLVAAGTSNGPMLSHSPPQYNKPATCNNGHEQTKEEFLRGERKRTEKPSNSNTIFCVQAKVKKASGTSVTGARLDKEVQQICMQRRQAAIERELRLQKSLSEECEDLGVDEPSTSDLFPEALLFDANNSPSFDQTSQDNLKRSSTLQVPLPEKEENKMTLFSEDDFMFETDEYDATTENQLNYEEVAEPRILPNGQGGNAVEDSTLLQTCTSMSDVTLSSPTSPDAFRTNEPPLNKYKHKYANKKKIDRPKPIDNWSAEVSSSEDTTGSTELPIENCTKQKHIETDDEDELSEGSFKVVRLAITKSTCDEMHCSADENSEDCSLSGRGARRAIKKKCSCCNGAEDNSISRKRPSSTHQHTNSPHKKAFPNKKR